MAGCGSYSKIEGDVYKRQPQTPSLADLLIAYYNQQKAGAWSNRARTGNLKQFAEAVNYLTENKLLTLEAVSYTHLDVYKRQS